MEFSAPLYVAAKTKLEKTNVIQGVVEKIRRDSVGGGFVKKDFQSGLWFEIGDDKGKPNDSCIFCREYVAFARTHLMLSSP